VTSLSQPFLTTEWYTQSTVKLTAHCAFHTLWHSLMLMLTVAIACTSVLRWEYRQLPLHQCWIS